MVRFMCCFERVLLRIYRFVLATIKIIRISPIKLFYTTIEEDVLLDQIRTHLDHSDWYIFKYEDYFTLKMLTKLTMKKFKDLR